MATTQPAPCCRRVTQGKKQQLMIETADGQRITLQDGPASVLVEDETGNSIELKNGNITVKAVGKISLQASTVQVNASQVAMNVPMVQCSGVVKADTVIANTVSAATYTPGAGNVW